MLLQIDIAQITGHDDEKRNVAVKISSPSSQMSWKLK